MLCLSIYYFTGYITWIFSNTALDVFTHLVIAFGQHRAQECPCLPHYTFQIEAMAHLQQM